MTLTPTVVGRITDLAPREWGFPAISTSNLIDRFVEEFSNNDWFNTKDTYPYNVAVKKTKDGELINTELTFAMAGIDKEDVNVKLEDNSLVITVNKPTQVEQDEDDKIITSFIHRGISTRSMKTKFNLNNVDVENITSSFKNGLLTISLPARGKAVKVIDIV